MAYDIATDARLDPRIAAILAFIPSMTAPDVANREELLAEANTDAAREGRKAFQSVMDLCDTEEAAPSTGLRVHTEQIVSSPAANSFTLRVIRPGTDETVA